MSTPKTPHHPKRANAALGDGLKTRQHSSHNREPEDPRLIALVQLLARCAAEHDYAAAHNPDHQPDS